MIKHIDNDISLFPVSLNKKKKKNRNERNEIINRITIGIHDLGNQQSYAQNEELTIIANIYNICIAVWSEFMELWIYITPNIIDDSLSGLEGCYNTVYLFNTSVEKCDGDGDDTDLREFYEKITCGFHYNYLIPKETTRNNVSSNNDNVSSNNDNVSSNNDNVSNNGNDKIIDNNDDDDDDKDEDVTIDDKEI